MSITIDGVPEFLTRDQYVAIFAAFGFSPQDVIELRAAPDGVHALVKARDEDGKRRYPFAKHRVFIPVRKSEADERTTRVTPVTTR